MGDIENPLLLSIYGWIVDGVMEETGNIEAANERLRDIGRGLGTNLYLNTEIADKTKDTITTREDVSKLIETVFKVLYDKKPNDLDMDSARGSIRVTDEECVWCQEVNLEGMRGFGYCEIFSGILESILDFKGVDVKVFQEMSRATGADACVWNVRLG
jgi:predicted hydrocarbon binding protein